MLSGDPGHNCRPRERTVELADEWTFRGEYILGPLVLIANIVTIDCYQVRE